MNVLLKPLKRVLKSKTTITLLIVGLVTIQFVPVLLPLGARADFEPSGHWLHGPGITHAQYPNGLNFPSFNNYTDNNSSVFPDERRFLKFKKIGGNYVDSMSVDPDGNWTIRFVAYVHNDANPNLNQGGSGPGVAHNVKTFVDSFHYDNDAGTWVTNPITNPVDIRQGISASFPADPLEVSDTATISSSTGEPLVLEYINNTLFYDGFNNGTSGSLDPSQFFGSGAPLGNPNHGSGDYWGCEPYKGYIYFDVRVEKPVEPNLAPVCVDLTANPPVADIGQVVNFTATAYDPDNDPITYFFEFGDNATDGPKSQNTSSHAYNASGTYTAQVTVTDPQGEYDICQTQVVINEPTQDKSKLTIDKSVVPASPTPANNPGDPNAQASYTIRVTNTITSGNGKTAINAKINDAFGIGTNGGEFTGITNVQGASYNNGVFTIAQIPAGQTKTITYKGHFSTRDISCVQQNQPTQKSDITNTATITDGGGVQIGNPSQDTAKVRLQGGYCAQNNKSVLTIDKRVSPASPTPANNPGEATAKAAYTIKVTNTVTQGNGVTATNVKIRDLFGNPTGGGNFINRTNINGATLNNNVFTIASIPPGSVRYITYDGNFSTNGISCVPSGDVTNKSDIINTATITNGGGANIGTPAFDDAKVRLQGGYCDGSKLTLSKSVVPASPTPANQEGEKTADAEYTIRVTNTKTSGNGKTAINAKVKDVFAPGNNGGKFTYVTNVRGATYSNGVFTIASIPSGQTAVVKYTGNFTTQGMQCVSSGKPVTKSDITNTATITNGGGVNIGNPKSDTATIRLLGGHCDLIQSRLTLYKSVRPASPDPVNEVGAKTGSANYTLRINNEVISGNGVNARNVEVTDEFGIPTHGGSVTSVTNVVGATYNNGVFTIPQVPQDQDTFVRYTVNFSTEGIQCVDTGRDIYTSEITNTATITGRGGALIGDPDSGEATVLLQGGHCDIQQSELTIEKSVVPTYPEPINNPGEETGTANYTLRITNRPISGGGADGINVEVTDEFGNSTNGGSLTSITNVSGATFSNGVFTIPRVPSGGTATVTYTGNFSTSGINCVPNSQILEVSDITNTATITGRGGVLIGDPDSDTATVRLQGGYCEIEDSSSLTISKSVSPSSPSPVNQVCDTTGQATYTLTLTNTITGGNGETAINSQVMDVFDPSTNGGSLTSITNVSGATYSNGVFTIASIPPGTSSTVTYTGNFSTSGIPTVTPSQSIQTSEITNTATISDGGGVDIGNPNSGTATILMQGCSEGEPNFTITKSVSDDRLEEGDDTTYTIRVTNSGTEEGTVTVTDTIGENNNGYIEGEDGGRIEYNNDMTVTGATNVSGDIGNSSGVIMTIQAGQTAIITYTVTADTDDMDEEESIVDNIALLSTGGEAEERVTLIQPEADVTISKSVSPTSAEDRDTVTYTIKIRNRGETTTDITLTDTIGDNNRGYINGRSGGRVIYIDNSIDIEGISSRDVSGDIDDEDGIEFEDVEPDDEIEITYEARVDTDGMACNSSSRVENTAEIEYDDESEEDDATLTINSPDCEGSFSILKSVTPSSVYHNGIVIYTINVSNNGSSSGTVTVTDTISTSGFIAGVNGGRMTYVSGSMNVSGATSYTGTIDNINGVTLTISGNSTATITYQATANDAGIPESSSSNVYNTAILTTGGQSSSTVSILTPSSPPPPPPPSGPRVVYVPAPPTTSQNGSGPIMLYSILLAMGGSGLFSIYLRRKQALSLLSQFIGIFKI